MIKSIIVDDERKHRETLNILLETYCPNVKVLAEAEDKNSLLEILSKHNPDLIFLDINLGSYTAFDILDDLNGSIDFKIVFITASERYAVEGYKYNAIDYLLKPIKVENLIEVVNKITKQQAKPTTKEIILDEIMQLYEGDSASLKISLTNTEQQNIVRIDDLLYCQSDKDHTIFKMMDAFEIKISKKLEHFENKLRAHKFLRISSSHMVNPRHIKLRPKEEDTFVVMINNEKLPLSKTYHKSFLKQLYSM